MRKTRQITSRGTRNKKMDEPLHSQRCDKQDKRVAREGQGNETRHKRTELSKRKVHICVD